MRFPESSQWCTCRLETKSETKGGGTDVGVVENVGNVQLTTARGRTIIKIMFERGAVTCRVT